MPLTEESPSKPVRYAAESAGLGRLGTATRRTYLGHAVLAGTGRGIVSILLGDAPEPLLACVRARHPEMPLTSGDPELEAWADAFVAYLENPLLGFRAPLDLRGTPFQIRVWHALSEVPVGTTTTYARLAERMGLSPKAARAVATACAANPIAVAVPCHRVVRSDGSLGGYSGGLERKHALLVREGALVG